MRIKFETNPIKEMAGTFSQIYIQVVFAVKFRESLLAKPWRSEVHRYIAGIITSKEQKCIIVNGVADHVHCFIGLNPSMCISYLVRDIKNNSSRFINESGWLRQRFQWQEGYGAFSYSHEHIRSVYNYILNQEQHHHEKSFKQEYTELLKTSQVPHKPEFLFDWLE